MRSKKANCSFLKRNFKSSPNKQLKVILIIFIFFACSMCTSKPYLIKQEDNNTDINLYYETYGAGRPILFIHGFGGRTYTWRYLLEPLSKNFQLFLIDLKGFGLSPKPRDDNYSAIAQASLVYQFIAKHRLRGVVIVGHSFGGLVSLLTALRLQESCPECLSALILIDSVSHQQSLPCYINLLRTPLIGNILTSIISKECQVKKILKLAYYDDNKISAESIRVYAEPLYMSNGQYALIQTAKEIIPPNPEFIMNQYQKIRVPTLLIWGNYDRIVPLYVGKRLNKSILNSELIVIDQSGHNPQEEQPESTIRVILQFLHENIK